MNLPTWFRNISIKNKLYFVGSVIGVLIAIELSTLVFSVHVLPIAITVEIAGLLMILLINNNISKDISEILKTSKQIALGNYSAKAPVYSHDEVGKLAQSFNTVTGKIEQDNHKLKAADKELAEIEGQYLKIFENNPIPMTFSEIGTEKVTYANNNFYNSFKYTKEEVIGHTIEELNLISPEENQRLIPIIMGHLNETRTIEELQALPPEETLELLQRLKEKMFKNGFEVKYTRKNGETFYAMVYYEIIEIGNKKYNLTCYKDVSDRKQAEEILKIKTKQIAEANNELIYANQTHEYAEETGLFGSYRYNFNTQKITYSNNMYRLLGYEPNEFVPKADSFMKFIHPDDLEYVSKSTSEIILNKHLTKWEYRIIRKDGRTINVRGTGKFIKETDTITFMVGIIQDITEQKQAEERAQTLIKEKIKAETVAQSAENAMRAKQQFLANMSHEIRTPMNAIIGFTKVMLKSNLTEKQREYLKAIKVSGDGLIVLINDILDFEKVNAGKISFEKKPFKMGTSISSMLFLFETKANEKNLELIKEYDNKIPEVLLGDLARLQQIMLNLLSNALKFTSTGKITVSVRLLKEDDEKVTIEFAVTDTGIGIPENKITTIFESFEQAYENTSRMFGGTGLGLAIVKQLVERQGGNITVKSKINEGSTFSFTLNFEKTEIEMGYDQDNFMEETETETVIVLPDREIKNLKVLVVEDNAFNQLLMKTILEDFGFDRDFAQDGKIAIEKFQSTHFDIILMDIQMPVMNGLEATQYIRNNLNSKVPIMALTANAIPEDIEKYKSVGMNDYIAKPFDEHLLYSKIIDLVKNTYV